MSWILFLKRNIYFEVFWHSKYHFFYNKLCFVYQFVVVINVNIYIYQYVLKFLSYSSWRFHEFMHLFVQNMLEQCQLIHCISKWSDVYFPVLAVSAVTCFYSRQKEYKENMMSTVNKEIYSSKNIQGYIKNTWYLNVRKRNSPKKETGQVRTVNFKTKYDIRQRFETKSLKCRHWGLLIFKANKPCWS